MKRGKGLIVILAVLLISMPAAADAHWSFRGGLIVGLGAGIVTGYILAPKPVPAVPPDHYAPPPPVVSPRYPGYAPAPVASPHPAPSACREWTVVSRHWEKRWDGSGGAWRDVLVERWGWAGVPCHN